jgi:hypothetical protein
VYVSNVLAASADWRTGAAAASWALTLAAWTSADFVSGGIPVPPTVPAVAIGPAVASGAAVRPERAGGLGRGDGGGNAGIDLGVAGQVARQRQHAGGDAPGRQADRQSQGDEARGLRELDAGDEVGLAAGALPDADRQRALAVGAREDRLLDLADLQRFGNHGRPRFLRCDLRCPARSTTGDVDGHGTFPRGGGAGHAARRNRTASLGNSASGRPSADGPVGAVRSPVARTSH